MKKINLLIWMLAPLMLLAQMPSETELNRPIDPAPEVRTGRLPNGLRYYIARNAKPEKRMELRLAVNAGSCLEENDQQGLAHFVEHMAFNGTTHFKKNELVDYLESIGTKFGPHLNAYTSFDETVYMMQVPTDSASQMNKAFQILEDWAHGITFDSVEVKKESGVVIEEWRLGQGAFERMRNQYWPILFSGSRYMERLPIGRKDILEKASVERLKAFYRDWYRPDLMAVVAVGDFDPEAIEKKILEHFTKLKNPAKPKPVTPWEVPPSPGVELAKAKDKEAPYTSIQMVYKVPSEPMKTEGQYRRVLIERLFSAMISARLDEQVHESGSVFNYAGGSYGDFVRNKGAYSLFAIVNEKNITKGITAFIDLNEGLKRFGFQPGELERALRQMKRQLEKQMNEGDKTESSRIINKIVSAHLYDRTYLDPMREMEMFVKYGNNIGISEINDFARELLRNPNENCVIIVQHPDKDAIKIPEPAEVMTLFREVAKRDVKPYNDFESGVPLIAKKPAAGKVVSEKTDEANGVVEWKLSNGAVVAVKKTDFKNDELLFRAFSWGGASIYPVEDDASASEAASIISNSGIGPYNYVEFNRFMKGRIASVRPYITETGEGMSGNSSITDLETFMQLIYSYFTAPRKDTLGFRTYMDQQKAFVENRNLDPESAYEDTIEVTMSNYHPRRRPWTPALLKEVKHDRAYQIYKERFDDASDFTFVFVGNVDIPSFKKYVEDYIASLPAKRIAESWVDVGIQTPKGKIKKTVKRGIEPKSSVTMKYTGPATYTPKESMDLKVLLKLMSIKLRESLREDNGGTYGVSCYGNISRIPKQEFSVTVEFGCAPENIDRLTKAAQNVIESVMNNGCDDKDLIKVKETFRREREVNLKENSWWLGVISARYSMKDEIPQQKELDEYLAKLKSDDFREAAKKYFSNENYAYFVWKPVN